MPASLSSAFALNAFVVTSGASWVLQLLKAMATHRQTTKISKNRRTNHDLTVFLTKERMPVLN